MLHPYMLFVVLAWGANFSMIKLTLQDFAPPATALFRYLLMLPVLVIACRAMSISLRVPRDLLKRLLFAGFIASGVYMVFFLEGMKTASPAQGAIALATAPIFISLFALGLKQESFRWGLVIGIIVAFAGVILVALGGGKAAGGSVVGTAIVLAGAVVWAWSVVLMKPLVEHVHPFAAMTISAFGAAFALVPYGAVSLVQTDWQGVTPVGWVGISYLAFVAGAMAFSAYYKALQDLGPARTGMIQYLIPPTAAVLSWFIMGEPVSLLRWIGLVIVLAGVYIAMRKPQTEAMAQADAEPESEPAVCAANGR